MKKNGIALIFIMTFVLSIVFSTLSNLVSSTNAPWYVLAILLIIVIILGVLFDMIGTAAISGEESTFHALNSKKIKEGKMGLYIVKNSSKISSICNDVVGDVSGIISGSIGAVLAIELSSITSISNSVISIVLAALISSFTVGGKAIFKSVAIKNADSIIISLAKVLSIFKKGK